jgi:hypothetical protein
MIEILEFLIKHLSFLISRGGYRFVDSGVSESFGGDSFIVLESKRVRWRIVKDRAQMFLEFQSIKCSKNNWYTTDLLQRMLANSAVKTAVLDASVARFIESKIEEIELMFDDSHRDKTLKSLGDLENIRAKERFG